MNILILYNDQKPQIKFSDKTLEFQKIEDEDKVDLNKDVDLIIFSSNVSENSDLRRILENETTLISCIYIESLAEIEQKAVPNFDFIIFAEDSFEKNEFLIKENYKKIKRRKKRINWFKNSLNSAKDAAIIVDSNHKVAFISEKAKKISRLSVNTDFSKIKKEKFSENKNGRQTIYILEQDGKQFLGIKYSTIRDSLGKEIGFLWLVFDINQKSRIETISDNDQLYRSLFAKSIEINKQLIEANEQLKIAQSQMIQQEKMASIGQLAAGVAHELNNPIGFVNSNFTSLEKYFQAIIEYLNLMKKTIRNNKDKIGEEEINQIEELEEENSIDFIIEDIEELFVDSKEGVERITEIVKNLRRFSRVDYENEMLPYDLNEGIRNTLVVAKNEIKYVADVNMELNEISPIEAIGGEINQVLLNMIVNAAQAIQEQDREGRAQINIRTYQKDDKVYCEIEDDGPGIPKDIQNKIYDPFFTTKQVGKGTGLGLNISYDIIVNKHKGKLILDSEPGKGTKFTLIFSIKLKK